MTQTTDDGYVYPQWTQGPPRISPELNAALEQMAAGYRQALDDLRIPYGPGKCAPAIGVHRGCEHDS